MRAGGDDFEAVWRCLEATKLQVDIAYHTVKQIMEMKSGTAPSNEGDDAYRQLAIERCHRALNAFGELALHCKFTDVSRPWASIRQVRDNPLSENSWLPIWAALSDESLEDRLRHYYRLSKTADIHQQWFAQLVAEAKRRGRPEVVEKAKEWVAHYGVLPSISRSNDSAALSATA
jgi:hypothetical protein